MHDLIKYYGTEVTVYLAHPYDSPDAEATLTVYLNLDVSNIFRFNNHRAENIKSSRTVARDANVFDTRGIIKGPLSSTSRYEGLKQFVTSTFTRKRAEKTIKIENRAPLDFQRPCLTAFRYEVIKNMTARGTVLIAR